MPVFRIGEPVAKWFKKIHKKEPLKTDFDLYYMCTLLGLATGRTSSPGKTSELVGYFIADYTETQHLLLGLFVLAELQRRGIDLDERVDVQRIINEILDPKDPTGLTSAGMTKMNEYASGGFDYFVEQYGGRSPVFVESFLERYVKILGEAVEGSEVWS